MLELRSLHCCITQITKDIVEFSVRLFGSLFRLNMAPVRSHHIHIGVCALYSNKHYNVCVLNTTYFPPFKGNFKLFPKYKSVQKYSKSEIV